MEFDRNKFKRLFHYAVWKAGRRDGFGATKLYKALWFSEASFFVNRGRPIAGATYIREKHGPVPKLALTIKEELVREGKISWWQDRYYNKSIHQFEAVLPPDTSDFTKEELITVDYWVQYIDKEHTATSISDESHDDSWGIAKIGEELPFHAYLARRIREPSDGELVQAKERLKKLKLA